jgi:hypothetical protein
MKDEVDMFRCGKCDRGPFQQELIVMHDARVYICCPNCAYEESYKDYSIRQLRESLRDGR